eukprot:5199228-Heterocapsa_arctica.AAC.1
MEVETPGAAAAVPGAMTQPDGQQPAPMEQDAGGEFTQEEQELWDKSQSARAAELGRELAGKLMAEKEEAAAKETTKGKGSPGKGRSPNLERIARRALRSPYKEKDRKGGEEEESPTLEPVLEEGESRRVPSDEEGEEAEEDAEAEKAQELPEGPPEDAD